MTDACCLVDSVPTVSFTNELGSLETQIYHQACAVPNHRNVLLEQ